MNNDKRNATRRACYRRNHAAELARSRARYHKNQPKNSMAVRMRRLRRAGCEITANQFKNMYDAQEGKCAVCGRFCPVAGSVEGICVDHCHRTGRVRALLCHTCNSTLGFVDDNSVLLEALASYVRKFDGEAGERSPEECSSRAFVGLSSAGGR